MKTILIIASMVLVLSLLALGFSCTQPTPAPAPAPAPAPKPEPIVLKSLTFLPSTNVNSTAYIEWLKSVTERAKGELVFDYLGGPEVIPYVEQPQAIKNGVVDISFLGASALKGMVPEARMMALSLLTFEEEYKAGATDLMRKYYANGGLYFVGRGDHKLFPGNFSFFLNKKVATPEDLKGIRLGAAGTFVDAAAKALGMSMTIIKSDDAYTALDTGMIDAYSYSLDGAKSYSLHEVTKYLLEPALYRSNSNIAMNPDAWNKLPPHLQKLILDVYIEFEPKFTEVKLKGLVDAKKTFEEAGVEVITFSAADAEKFISISYAAEADKYLKEMPDTATEYLKLVKAIK